MSLIINFSRVSEGTLGSFSVRFCGMFVLPYLAVLLPGGAVGTLVAAAAPAVAAAAAAPPERTGTSAQGTPPKAMAPESTCKSASDTAGSELKYMPRVGGRGGSP